MIADKPHATSTIYKRTEAGQAELLFQREELGALQRRLLSSVTGLTPLHHLLDLLNAPDEGVTAAIDLLSRGLIAPSNTAASTSALAGMTEYR